MKLTASNGMKLEFGQTDIRKVTAGGQSPALSGPGGFSVEEFLTPRAERRNHGSFVGEYRPAGADVRFDGGIPEAALEVTATFRGGQYISVEGEIRDLSGVDRALRLTFTLPLKLAGWKWENTAATARTIRPGQQYPSEPSDFVYIGIQGDGFADEIPDVLPVRTNKLPFSCVSRGTVGVALGHPIHEPRVFLIGANEAGYSISFDLGVTPITRKFPSRAAFRFMIYPVDAAWGIRSAAERFHGFFPDLFQVRLNRHGYCGTLNTANLPTDDLRKRGWAYQDNDYQWSGGEISKEAHAVERKYDILSFHWRGPWYWFHEAPGDITRDAQLALMKAQAEGRAPGAHGANNQLCGCPDDISAKAAYNSYIENVNGKLERIFFCYPHVSCWLMPGNMDPNLPKPNRSSLAEDWQYRYRKLWKKKSFRGPRAFAYDALDDFSGFRRLNFRREHLAVMDIPATFDPETGRVGQVKGFGDWAWAKRHAKLVRDDGGFLMANCNLEHAMMFIHPYFDVVFRERRLQDSDEEKLSVHRMLCGAKPFSYIGGHRMPADAEGWQQMADRALLFGMFPGEVREPNAEPNFGDIVRRVAEAGWRPVTHAYAPGLLVERFGDQPGELCFTVRNTGKRSARSRMTIDLKGLGLMKNGARLEVSPVTPSGAVAFTRSAGTLAGTVAVAPGRTIALAVNRRR